MRFAFRCTVAIIMTTVTMMMCSTRDHDNPFDPENPNTEGRPMELHAIPAVDFISLFWSFPEIGDIDTARLLMSAPETALVLLRDNIPANGHMKVYFGTVESDQRNFWMEIGVDGWSGEHVSDTTSAIYSGGQCWIAHGYDHVSWYSPESGTYLPARSLGSYLIDGCSSGTSLWMIGTPGGLLYFVSTDGETVSLDHSISFGYQLNSCDLSGDGRLLLSHNAGLIWYDPYWADSSPWPVETGSDIRFVRLTPEDDGIWIWEDSDSVSFVREGDLTPVNKWRVSNIADIAPSFNSVCWIATETGVVRLDGNSGEMNTFDYRCGSIAPSSQERCWASLPAENTIILLNRSGEIERSIAGIEEPGDLAHIPGTNVLWCGTSDQTLIKVLTDGRIASSASLPNSPWHISPN